VAVKPIMAKRGGNSSGVMAAVILTVIFSFLKRVGMLAC